MEKTENIEELVELYNVADVFVNPTLEDNFPTTNIEAIACGTPVVTFDSGGSSEIIDDTCGIVVKKLIFKNFIKLFILLNLIQRISIAKNARRRACDLYSKNDKFNEYIKLYESILLEGKKNNEKNRTI